MKFFYFICVISLAALSSCRTQREPIRNYLEKASDSTGRNLVRLVEPTIQKNDLLSIKVFSLSTDPRVDALYNLPEQTLAGSGAAGTAGFLVDESGNIDYPRLGMINVVGLKKTELAQLIKARLDTILRSPTVIVRFLNYRVTVLGEVRSPGTFSVPAERVTILEAVGLAGDITDYGNKATVKVMRDSSGYVAVHTVNLTDQQLFQSPYYRLQQNDVVFVEQNRRKTQQQEQQTVAQQIGIASSIITAIALIINIIR